MRCSRHRKPKPNRAANSNQLSRRAPNPRTRQIYTPRANWSLKAPHLDLRLLFEIIHLHTWAFATWVAPSGGLQLLRWEPHNTNKRAVGSWLPSPFIITSIIISSIISIFSIVSIISIISTSSIISMMIIILITPSLLSVCSIAQHHRNQVAQERYRHFPFCMLSPNQPCTKDHTASLYELNPDRQMGQRTVCGLFRTSFMRGAWL